MATWCLTKQSEEALMDALRKDGDPQKLRDRVIAGTSREWFAKYVGEENAVHVNALFESKLLVKNQLEGFKSFLKRVGGPKQAQRNFLNKVQAVDKAMSKAQIEAHLEDYVNTKLGMDITKEQFDKLTELSKKTDELKQSWLQKLKENEGNLEEFLKTHQKEKLEYGASQVVFNNYADELRGVNDPVKEMFSGRMRELGTSFKDNKTKAIVDITRDTLNFIADNSISMVATLDNSFIGRQGLHTLMTHPSRWLPAAKNSFLDMAKVMGGKNAMDALMADVYSDPQYLDGSYQKAGILAKKEEQFPTSLPGRITVVGRVFRASEAAFEGSGIRMRTGLYKLMEKNNIKNGVNMKDPKEIKSVGIIVNSLTARGDIGMVKSGGAVKLLLWAPKMLKGNIDVLTAHVGQDITPAMRKEARLNWLKIIGETALFMAIAKALDPDSIETDPTSSDFGKLKIGKNHDTRIDFTAGASSIIVLAARIASGHYKSSSGDIIDYEAGFGKRSALDAIVDFISNKTPPMTGAVIDYLRESDFKGNKPTLLGELYSRNTPISLQNLIDLKDNASVDKIIGIITDFSGLNSNSYSDPNVKSGIIPEKTKISKGNFINQVLVYAKAMQVDPETAFNRIFTGQQIMQVSEGNIIVVKRQDVGDSEAFKKQWVKENGGSVSNIKEVRLDHIIPNKLGGAETSDNWAVVTTSVWSGNTKVENTLIAAVKSKKISLKEAQNLITRFKRVGRNSQGYKTENPDKKLGESIINKYK